MFACEWLSMTFSDENAAHIPVPSNYFRFVLVDRRIHKIIVRDGGVKIFV